MQTLNKDESKQSQLTSTVIRGGYCIGCGACAVISDNYKIKLDKYGQFQANRAYDNREQEGAVEAVCPFSDTALNEDELSSQLFGNIYKHNLLGRTVNNYFGYSTQYREKGASGGLTTWFLVSLLEHKIVDAVIHLKKSSKKGLLYEYGISFSSKDVLLEAKTKYYPGEMSDVLNTILNDAPRKYAIVGVPCFIKAARLLAEKNEEIKKRLVSFVGLICGHYKSTHYTSMLAFQKGISPETIISVDYRHKTGKGLAGDYSTLINYKEEEGNNTKSYMSSVNDFYGTNWGLGLFKYNACDYCDDVVAETADVAFGDAWISPYNKDPMGTSVVLLRNKDYEELFQDGLKRGDLLLNPASLEDVVRTQSAGFRHRRDGLALRLSWKQNKQQWVPRKRVNAQKEGMSIRYKAIYYMRLKLSQNSHKYFNKALFNRSFKEFKYRMFLSLFIYNHILYNIPKVANRIKNIIKK